MCCFSRPVTHVANTRLFARRLPSGRQALVYQMVVETATPTAMILPLPVAVPTPETGENASVRFHSLKEYPNFFSDMARLFLPPNAPMAGAGGMGGGGMAGAMASRLEVHEVGDYVASFVPTISAFSRLDPQFVLGPEVWSKMPWYADYGFAVFQLKVTEKKRAQVHPIAFDFTTRFLDRLFFPTVHIHHGVVPPREEFDHALYFQSERPGGSYERARRKADGIVKAEKTRGLFDPMLPTFRWRLHDVLPNRDMWIRG
jgi:hypothetical protein